ncbi:hypothetical protein C8R48DRAFT_619580, partial [Suillus tomentosus]
MKRGRFLPGHPQHDTHVLRFRSEPVVPVLLGPGIPRSDGSEEDYERYCRSILLLFKSWRDLGDLQAECATWSAALDACDFSPSLKAVIRNMNVENECKEARDA